MKRFMKLLMTLLLLSGLTGCSGEEEMKAPELLEPVDVKLDMAQVCKGEIYQASSYAGEVIPYTEELYFLVDGELEDIYVMMGDMVQEGDILAVLSEEQLKEQIEDLEDEIGHLVKEREFSDRLAEADIEIARQELEMLHALGDPGVEGWVKTLEIQAMELELREARELHGLELQQKQASLKKLRDRLGKNQITAPYSGRIVYVREGKKGDAVQGYVPMIYIADDSRLSLSTDYVSELSIRNADRVCARIVDTEYEISYIPYEASELVKMALSGEEMKARFSIDTPDGQLCAGQYAAVVVYQQYKEDVLTIPINALYRDGSGQYVYKQADGVRVRCDVKAGLTTDTKAEIQEGLEEGDIVYVKD